MNKNLLFKNKKCGLYNILLLLILININLNTSNCNMNLLLSNILSNIVLSSPRPSSVFFCPVFLLPRHFKWLFTVYHIPVPKPSQLALFYSFGTSYAFISYVTMFPSVLLVLIKDFFL